MSEQTVLRVPPEIRYEDNARPDTVSVWRCKTCSRPFVIDTLFGWTAEKAEANARACCATDVPCPTEGCTERARSLTYPCYTCRMKKAAERYAKLEVVEWDGETPLTLHDDDRYFFSVEELEDFIEECVDSSWESLSAESVYDYLQRLQLELCEPVLVPVFDAHDYLQDELPEDWTLSGTAEVEKVVDDWAKEALKGVWVGAFKRPSIKSMMDALGLAMPE